MSQFPVTPTKGVRLGAKPTAIATAAHEPTPEFDLTQRYGVVYASSDFVRRSPKYAGLMAGARVLKADVDPATNSVMYTLLHPLFEEVKPFNTAPVYRVVRWDDMTPVFEMVGRPSNMRNFRMDTDWQEQTDGAPVDRGPVFVVENLVK